MLWLGVLYLGSLAIMLVAAFWTTDDFTGQLVKTPTFKNFHTLLTGQVYWVVALRTLGIAIAVTLIDMVLAVPIAFTAAKVVRSRGLRYALVIAVTMPLWAGYLVKGYAMETYNQMLWVTACSACLSAAWLLGDSTMGDALAFVSGSSKRHGSIKDGTTLTDTSPEEIERVIDSL